MATIVCDIDGTLLRSGTQPMKGTIDFLKQNDPKYTIVIITARPASRRAETVASLRRAGVPYSRLMMNDIGPTHQDGLESKRKNINSLSGVVLAIDNDADVRAIYSKAGVKAVSPGQLTSNLLNKNFWNGVLR